MEYNECMNHKALQHLLKTLGGGPRLSILLYLRKTRGASVSDVAFAIRRSLATTSLHLARLERAGILKRVRRGLEVHYRISLAQNLIVKLILKEL